MCAVLREVSSDDAVPSESHLLDSSVAESTGAKFVDLTSYFCSSFCPPIIGNTLVYRDGSHITSTYASSLSSVLYEVAVRR